MSENIGPFIVIGLVMIMCSLFLALPSLIFKKAEVLAKNFFVVSSAYLAFLIFFILNACKIEGYEAGSYAIAYCVMLLLYPIFFIVELICFYLINKKKSDSISLKYKKVLVIAIITILLCIGAAIYYVETHNVCYFTKD